MYASFISCLVMFVLFLFHRKSMIDLLVQICFWLFNGFLCTAHGLVCFLLSTLQIFLTHDWDRVPSTGLFCEQVSLKEYECQKLSGSQQALQDLLENIVRDKRMSQRDKRKRLKQVQLELHLTVFPHE